MPLTDTVGVTDTLTDDESLTDTLGVTDIEPLGVNDTISLTHTPEQSQTHWMSHSQSR
jgi:hypothetical protein